MLKRISAISVILLLTSVAWMILGSTIERRTFHSDERLRSGVASIWGAPQEQAPPTASYDSVEQKVVEEAETGGRKTTRTESHHRTVPVPLDSTRAEVALDLKHRQKGLLWYSTYWVRFASVYTFRNPTAAPQEFSFRLGLPAEQAIYDGLTMEVNGRALPLAWDASGASVTAAVPAGEKAVLRVAYRSRGLGQWRYRLGDKGIQQARDFELRVRTNFKQIDFPPDTLSPTEKTETPGGWDLTWKHTNLISGFRIGVAMPEKLQPGPLAGQISYFAPVSLLLFFFLMFIITTLRSIDLHPMNYFFLATAFFAFHLLLAYLVDVISIHLAFLICSAVSIFLVVSYLRIVVGPRFALIEAGGAQFIYLVLFSYAFFLEGATGLAVTIGCIVTLFVVMQMTARIRWTERFSRPAPIPAGGDPR